MRFFWIEHLEIVKEWNELYSSISNMLSNGEERNITEPLYTMVQTNPHTFKKSQITYIKNDDGYFIGKHLVLGIENEDGKAEIKIYPQFELKTDGKIKDIVLILLFIKTNLLAKKTIKTEETIV